MLGGADSDGTPAVFAAGMGWGGGIKWGDGSLLVAGWLSAAAAAVAWLNALLSSCVAMSTADSHGKIRVFEQFAVLYVLCSQQTLKCGEHYAGGRYYVSHKLCPGVPKKHVECAWH